jgi:hypothetical protein
MGVAIIFAAAGWNFKAKGDAAEQRHSLRPTALAVYAPGQAAQVAYAAVQCLCMCGHEMRVSIIRRQAAAAQQASSAAAAAAAKAAAAAAAAAAAQS